MAEKYVEMASDEQLEAMLKLFSDEQPSEADTTTNIIHDIAAPEVSEMAAFHAQVRAAIPPGFLVPKNEFIIRDDRMNLVCGLIQPMRWARRLDQSGYALEIAFAARDGTIRRMVLEDREFGGRSGIASLMDHGFCVYGAPSEVKLLLRNWPDVPVVWRADRTGWLETPQGEVYMRADGTCLSRTDPEPAVIMVKPEHYTLTKKGTFAGWKEQVALPALGNDMLVFALCATLAAPLLKRAAIETAMFNLHAKGPVGKSLLITVSTSADRSPATGVRWSVETTVLQQLLERTRDGVLALDALSENPSAKLLGHLTGLGDDGTYSQNDRDWRGVTLSTAERPLKALLSRFRKVVPAAMISRIVDIPIDTGCHGCLDNLHGHQDAEAFIAAMRIGFNSHYGHLMPAFIEKIIDDSAEIDRMLPERIKETVAAIMTGIGVDADEIDKPHREALRRLALTAVAGEMAIGFGLLPWPENTALSAVCKIASRWLERELSDRCPGDVLRRLQLFLDQNDALLVWMDRVDDGDKGDKSLGWQDDDYYYLTAQHVDAVSGLKEAIPALVELGIVVPNNERNSWKFRFGRKFGVRWRYYRIRKGFSLMGHPPDSSRQ